MAATKSSDFAKPYTAAPHPSGSPFSLQQEGHDGVTVASPDQWVQGTVGGGFPLQQEGHDGVSVGSGVVNAKALGDLSSP